jgi:Xaa-Pro dipeptidase
VTGVGDRAANHVSPDLEGKADGLVEDSDEGAPFRQRRPFMYLTGADELMDAYLIYESATDKSTLYVPPVDPESVIWAGLPLSVEEAKDRFDVDEVLPSTELNATLAKLGAANKQTVVHAIADRVADHVSFLEFESKDFSILAEAIDECRVVKDEFEIALIRKANSISEAGHLAVLKALSGLSNEVEPFGLFQGHCTRHGAKYQSYPSISASGRAAATLHYVHNNKDLKGKDLLLLDAGCEWRTYASDIVSSREKSKFYSGKLTDGTTHRHVPSPSPVNSPRSPASSTTLS